MLTACFDNNVALGPQIHLWCGWSNIMRFCLHTNISKHRGIYNTRPPVSSEAILRRGVISTCGYLGGLPLTCATGSSCFFDSGQKLMGCCEASSSASCRLVQACIPFASLPTIIDSYNRMRTLLCTDKMRPYCAPLVGSLGRTQYTAFDCWTVSIRMTVQLRFPQTYNIISSSTLFSSPTGNSNNNNNNNNNVYIPAAYEHNENYPTGKVLSRIDGYNVNTTLDLDFSVHVGVGIGVGGGLIFLLVIVWYVNQTIYTPRPNLDRTFQRRIKGCLSRSTKKTRASERAVEKKDDIVLNKSNSTSMEADPASDSTTGVPRQGISSPEGPYSSHKSPGIQFSICSLRL